MVFLALSFTISSPADRPLSPTNCREGEGSGISSFPNWLSGTWSHICYLVGFCREGVIFFKFFFKIVFQLLNFWCVLCSAIFCYIFSDMAAWNNTGQPGASHSLKYCTAVWKRVPHFLFEDCFIAKSKVSMTQKYKFSNLITHDFGQMVLLNMTLKKCAVYTVSKQNKWKLWSPSCLAAMTNLTA